LNLPTKLYEIAGRERERREHLLLVSYKQGIKCGEEERKGGERRKDTDLRVKKQGGTGVYILMKGNVPGRDEEGNVK